MARRRQFVQYQPCERPDKTRRIEDEKSRQEKAAVVFEATSHLLKVAQDSTRKCTSSLDHAQPTAREPVHGSPKVEDEVEAELALRCLAGEPVVRRMVRQMIQSGGGMILQREYLIWRVREETEARLSIAARDTAAGGNAVGPA